jgi:circadian clock protein KaiC
VDQKGITDNDPAGKHFALSAHVVHAVPKRPTGIKGFDEITGGGLPDGRLTAIIGSPGAGKTVFALQTLVNRLKIDGEACVFVTFEEAVDRLRANAGSFDWEFDMLAEDQFRFVDARLPADTALSGAFDLSGLLAGLSVLVAETGARSVVFDGIDMLLTILRDEHLARQELIRLDTWIREAGLSALITVKSFGIGERDQTRADFLQYMTDCVVVLDGTFTETSTSRTIRVAKYRGSDFVANPVPVVISQAGFEVVLLKASRSNYPTFTERVPSGVARLDALLNGGYLRGSSILVSGSPGTCKTSLAASFAAATCARGGKTLFVCFDENGVHIVANMKSIGVDLAPYVESGQVRFLSLLSNSRSPEAHFVAIRDALERDAPDGLIIDPISSLLKGDYAFAGMICEALLDHAKSLGITILCTSLLKQVSGNTELSASQVSTIADTWIHVSYVAREGERNRALTIVKSRGTDHSNQVRELMLSHSGIDLADVYVAEGEVLMGTARAEKEAEANRLSFLADIEAKRRRLDLDRELAELAARVEAAKLELEWKQQEIEFLRAAESRQLEMRQAAAIHRLDLRRSADDLAKNPSDRAETKRDPRS